MALVSFTGLVLSLYQRLALGAPCITWVLLFWHVDSLARGPNQPRALTIFSKQLITFAITFATSPRSYLQGQDTGLQHFKPKPSCSPSGTQETHSVFTMWYFCSRPMAPDSHITVAITGKHWLVHHLGWKPGIRVVYTVASCADFTLYWAFPMLLEWVVDIQMKLMVLVSCTGDKRGILRFFLNKVYIFIGAFFSLSYKCAHAMQIMYQFHISMNQFFLHLPAETS